jgi:S-adenosylmethionine-dependent methyltransferase
MKPIFLYGAGVRGRKCAEYLKFIQAPLIGFIDRDPLKIGKDFCYIPVYNLEEANVRTDEFTEFVSIKEPERSAVKNELAQVIGDHFYDDSEDPLGLMRFVQPDKEIQTDFIKKGFTPEQEKYLTQLFARIEDPDVPFAHTFNTLNHYREHIIPWIHDEAVSLNGAEILEIGCGTGSLMAALAEQGAKVTGIDIVDGSLKLARQRMDIMGLSAEILNLSGTEIDSLNKRFDFVLYPASLEHMTYSEKITSIKKAFSIGRKIGVIEVPNRLYYDDSHTTWMPFYNWLPDDVAADYLRFVERAIVKNSLSDDMTGQEKQLKLQRHGRSISFHEFDIALGLSNYNVLSDLTLFYNGLHKPFSYFLQNLMPNKHIGWFSDYLNILMEAKS